ncbi:MAG: alanine dehydrogenase [SAR202 cluster bacterium]|nr:alanine dehydrogenase [SAR202 cluster bacterium]|tara:strand:- start:78 stop:1169 length:1092 start_codon:yes stop_codon:yes gene_type:complete
MIIGVPKEIKNNEFRVGLTPDSVKKLTAENHEVFIEESAGAIIGFSDVDYENSGAKILKSAKEIYESSELIIKVKEPLPSEFKYLSKNNILFTYLHLAGNKDQSIKLANTGVTGIAYETVTANDGSLPLLSPMSSIAGQLSIIVGSYFLLKHNKGKGTLIGSVSDLEPRIITVIGAGVAGTEAIDKALSNKAHVKIIELSDNRLNELKDKFGNNNIEYIKSSPENISDALKVSDIVVGSVYIVGKKAPTVVTREMISNMKPGSVMVDISIDQGGCFETSKVTTHDNPTFLIDGVLHYCVANMPGSVPLTATEALNKVTLPYILDIANKGLEKSIKDDKNLFNGLNIRDGEIVHKSVKESLERI